MRFGHKSIALVLFFTLPAFGLAAEKGTKAIPAKKPHHSLRGVVVSVQQDKANGSQQIKVKVHHAHAKKLAKNAAAAASPKKAKNNGVVTVHVHMRDEVCEGRSQPGQGSSSLGPTLGCPPGSARPRRLHRQAQRQACGHRDAPAQQEGDAARHHEEAVEAQEAAVTSTDRTGTPHLPRPKPGAKAQRVGQLSTPRARLGLVLGTHRSLRFRVMVMRVSVNRHAGAEGARQHLAADNLFRRPLALDAAILKTQNKMGQAADHAQVV